MIFGEPCRHQFSRFRSIMLAVAVCLVAISFANAWNAPVNNASQLKMLRSRFSSGVPASTPDDAKRMWWRIAGRYNSTQSEYWRAIGEIALLDNDPEAAASEFKQGLVVEPRSYKLYLELAELQTKMHEPGAAIASYEQAVQVDPRASVQPYLYAADIQVQLGNYGSVAAWYEKARTYFPTDHRPDLAQGMYALRFGRLEEAERFLLMAHGKNSSNPDSLYYLSIAKERQNDLVDAAKYMEMAASVYPSPQDTCTWFRTAGDLYRQAENSPQARRVYEKGLAKCPGDLALQSNLKSIQDSFER